jgi:hypothetical protein
MLGPLGAAMRRERAHAKPWCSAGPKADGDRDRLREPRRKLPGKAGVDVDEPYKLAGQLDPIDICSSLLMERSRD